MNRTAEAIFCALYAAVAAIVIMLDVSNLH